MSRLKLAALAAASTAALLSANAHAADIAAPADATEVDKVDAFNGTAVANTEAAA